MSGKRKIIVAGLLLGVAALAVYAYQTEGWWNFAMVLAAWFSKFSKGLGRRDAGQGRCQSCVYRRAAGQQVAPRGYGQPVNISRSSRRLRPQQNHRCKQNC
jgi:hypothetical protein